MKCTRCAPDIGQQSRLRWCSGTVCTQTHMHYPVCDSASMSVWSVQCACCFLSAHRCSQTGYASVCNQYMALASHELNSLSCIDFGLRVRKPHLQALSITAAELACLLDGANCGSDGNKTILCVRGIGLLMVYGGSPVIDERRRLPFCICRMTNDSQDLRPLEWLRGKCTLCLVRLHASYDS